MDIVPEVRTVWVHGDLCEDYHVWDYDGAEPETGYLCRACDLIVDSDHMKQHPRAVHLARYRADCDRLARLAASRPVIRGGDPADNLIERALRTERERLAREPLSPDEPERESWLLEMLARSAACAGT